MSAPAAVTHTDAEPELSLRDLLDVLLRRRRVILVAFVACLVGALGSTFLLPPRYRAAATVVLDRAGSTATLFPELAGLSTQSYLDTLAEVARSRSVAERAVRLLGPAPDEAGDPVERLQRELRVTRVRGADMIRIEVTHRVPEQAARRAQAVTDAFLAFLLEGRRTQARATREFIEQQLAKVSRDLRSAEDALLRFKLTHGEVSLPEETRIRLEKLADLSAQLVTTETERRAAEAQRDRATEELRRREQITPSTWVASPLIQSLRQQLASLEIQLAGLLEKFTERHPEVVATRAQIAETQRRLEAELRRSLLAQTYTVDPIYQGLVQQAVSAEVTAATLRAREEALRQAVQRWTGEIRDLPPRELALARLTRQQKVAENVYLMLSQKYHEARIAEASVVPDLRIVDRARPPERPAFPQRGLVAGLGAVVGIFVAVAAAFTAERLDSRFHRPDEAEQTLGLPMLAMVPHLHQTDGKVPLAQDSRRSVFAESFRTLRTGVLYSAPEGSLRTLLVTSPELGDGKSTVAANLALALARSGRRVALVDADLRRPSLLEVLQPPQPFGLSDHLVGEVGLDDVVQPTRYPNLLFVPAGRTAPNPAELLGSQRMRDFLERLRERVDVVVLDTPPVMAVTDAVILARDSDGVILVINPGTTHREAAVRARRQLEALGARVLGFVFNDAPVDSRRGYYGYAYYGYYAYGEEPEEAQTRGQS
ncbi:MAG: polysaccharide biosynthesis tyrosine autokinase [Armatimonadota bacterium]|nr:polysaccharide biosynthesis tyrosine autokinase [Armatimonadota bacterium]